MSGAAFGEYRSSYTALTDREQRRLRLDVNGALVTSAQDSSGNVAPSGTSTEPVYTLPAAGSTQAVVGNVASGATDSGAPVKVAGVFNTALPTLTNGQRGDLQMTAKGIPYATLAGTTGTAITNGTLTSDGISLSGVGIDARSFGYLCNGTTEDKARKPNLFARIASSAAAGNPAFLKASAGDVMQFWGLCGATAVFLQIYNKTTPPILTYPILASERFTQTIPNGGAYCPTGIAYAFTTDAAGTTGSAAAAITSFALLAA